MLTEILVVLIVLMRISNSLNLEINDSECLLQCPIQVIQKMLYLKMTSFKFENNCMKIQLLNEQ